MSELADFVKELESLTVSTSQNVIVSSAEQKKQVKILIVSTHVNQTNGYSKVAFNLISQLATHDWLNIVHFGTQRLANVDLQRSYPRSVKVIDGSALEKDKQAGFAFAQLPAVIQQEKPDIVFIYNDLSVICTYIESIRKTIDARTFKIWAYIDQNYLAPPVQMIDVINRDVERVICFTKSWKEYIKTQGITRPVDVLNHGVNAKITRPIPKEMARQTLGLPKDVFLFTSMNKNIPRKRLDLLIMSFVNLITRFTTKPIFLLIVADKGDHGGFQLFDIFARELKAIGASIDMYGNRLLLTSKDTCYTDEDMNMLNNCGDAGVSCAEGEGFGLCSFEQMALGIPQIVPEINGYTEYCTSDNSLLVKPAFRCYLPHMYHSALGEAQMVDPKVVSKAMERYVFDENLRSSHGKNAKETVKEYTWEKCTANLIKRLQRVKEDEDD
jgi:glycosyltransferase involved in cell wall biosynthesis